MGDQKQQQATEHTTKSHEKDAVKSAHTVETTTPGTNTHILSRLSSGGSLPPVRGTGLSHPTAAAHQAAMLRTLQRRQGNAFVQRAVAEGHSTAGISDHAVEQAQSDQSSGQSLDSSVQTDMEARFGQDFSGVRVHTDTGAADLAKGIHAQAFTRGQDIYFGDGQYQPGASQGRHLLAHELTHTIQQDSRQSLARSTIQLRHPVSNSDEPMEKEAEDVADLVMNSKSLPAKPISLLRADREGQIAREEETATPDKQTIDTVAVNNAVDIIIKGLKGITTKGDSAEILGQFQGQNAAMVRAIIQELKNRGGQFGKSPEEMIGWLFGDMTAEDSRSLRALLIQRGVVEDISRIVASLVKDRLKGYTSDEDSQEILNALTEFKGAGLDEVLIQLENQTGKSIDEMSNWLFGDMDRANSERLRQYFFQSKATRATRYAVVRTAAKIIDLLSGYTSHADSSSIVWNFEHTPEECQRDVLDLIGKYAREERSQSVEQVLMHDMDQSDYYALSKIPALSSLPVYSPIARSLFREILSSLEWIEIAAEILAGGVVGIVTGLLSAIGGIIGSVVDIAVAAKHLVMSFLYQVSSGAIGSEDWLAVKEFFSGIKGLSDPGALLKKAWEETKLESSIIEGPFEYGRRAEFWVRKVIDLIVNVAMIAAAGYGLAKAAAAGVTEVAALIKEFGFIRGLAKASRQALRAIGKLITLPFKQASELLELLRKPLQTLAAVGQKINRLLIAIEDQGLWAFLRGRAGELAAEEIRSWKNQKKAWSERATLKQKQYNDLLDEANTIKGELEHDQAPPSPDENVKGIDQDADQLKKEVDQLEKDVLGKEQTKEPESEPQPTQEEPAAKPSPTEKPPDMPEEKPAGTAEAREKTPDETEQEKKPKKPTREQKAAERKAKRERKAAEREAERQKKALEREAAAREDFEQTKKRLQQENAEHRQKIEELTKEIEQLEEEAKRLRSEAREAEKASDKVGRERAKNLREEATEKSADAEAARRTRREHGDSIENNNRMLANKEAQLKQLLPCFSGDTHIIMLTGSVRIDQIQPGESLLTFDFERNEVKTRRVIEVFVNKTQHFYDIQVEGTIIHATGAHRFWIEGDAQWVAARDLKVGMKCKMVDGQSATVTGIVLREGLESPTYNLSVDIDHNYFVGPGILVHNAGVAKYGYGDLIIYEARNRKFPGKVYIGQTDDLSRRQGEHWGDARKALRDRSKLSEEEIEFREFMQGVELEPRIEGLNQVQANYMERKNVRLEMELKESKVMNRNLKKEDIDRMEELEKEIIEGGNCPQ